MAPPWGRDCRFGQVPWAQHKQRFKRLNEPDVSYHGVVYTEALGPAAYIGRARVVPCVTPAQRSRLSMPSSFCRALKNLELAHGPHQRKHAQDRPVPAKHPRVKWVNYVGLEDHPENPLVRSTCQAKHFRFADLRRAGGREGGARFLDGCSCSRAWSTSAMCARWHPSGVDHPPATVARRAGQDRCGRRHRSLVDWH